MTSSLSLYECLQQVSLQKYHGKFLQRGIVDVSGMLSLTMQDYPSLGISSMADRQNLFYLIQSIKTLQPQPQPQPNERQLRSRGRKDGLLPLDGAAMKEKGIWSIRGQIIPVAWPCWEKIKIANAVLKRLGGGGGILPSNKPTGMCRGMGFHFHAWAQWGFIFNTVIRMPSHAGLSGYMVNSKLFLTFLLGLYN